MVKIGIRLMFIIGMFALFFGILGATNPKPCPAVLCGGWCSEWSDCLPECQCVMQPWGDVACKPK